jgi:hypothetical protein
MPAQWPIFINNLSKKLASRTSKGPDDIGMFVANEYFNAVKTAQTPFGNIHQSGQKPILEEGFKKAFNMLFESLEPQLEDKFGNPLFDDMFEKLPEIDLSANPDCDFEEWTIKNKETIDPFQFYHLFPSTCIIPKPVVPETNLFGNIGINNGNGDITSENVDNQPELRYVVMSVVGGDGTSPYEFTYSLNGEIQPTLTSDSAGIVKFLAPTDPGKYEYTFISAMDASKKAEIKNIDKSASIEIKEDSSAVEIKIDTPKPQQSVKPMTEAERIDEIANRVIYQNDGTEDYLDWVERLPYHGAFAKKVSKKVLEFLDKESALIKKSTRVEGLPTSNATGNQNVTGFYYEDRIRTARENTRKAREKYNQLNTKENADSIEKRYAFVEVIQAEIFEERVELSNNTRNGNSVSASRNADRIEVLNTQLAKELQLINILTIKKNINEIKDVDSIEFIMANIKLYQNELVIARLDKDERKIDTLNRELTVLSLRILKIQNKINKEAKTNDRLFQEEYSDRPDIIPDWITANFVCIFTYYEGIDDNQRGAPDKNPVISVTNTRTGTGTNQNNTSGYGGYYGYSYGNTPTPETYKQWAQRTEPGRLRGKLAKYELEKVKYRDLKIRHINQIAEDNANAGNACGADDAYCVMAKCILDYWKSTAAQPFAKAPPILPCLIPDPGSYVPVYYGDESKLGGDLRRAWNSGKRFKLEPNLQTATRVVATAVAVSCAKHLKDLKFIYNGKIPVGTGTAPMIGFSPTAF